MGTRPAEKKGFHLDLCLFEFLVDVKETAIEIESNVLVKWYRSTAKTYNAQWIPWAVGKKTAAKRSKRQKTEPAIWTSEIPVRDVVMAVEVTNEQGFVKIMSASIKRISEYTDHYEDGDDSDDDSEGLM